LDTVDQSAKSSEDLTLLMTDHIPIPEETSHIPVTNYIHHNLQLANHICQL